MDLSEVKNLEVETPELKLARLLDEAVLRGLPRCTGTMYRQGRFCALGAAYFVDTGKLPHPDHCLNEWVYQFGPLRNEILKLNDEEGYSFRQIAALLRRGEI